MESVTLPVLTDSPENSDIVSGHLFCWFQGQGALSHVGMPWSLKQKKIRFSTKYLVANLTQTKEWKSNSKSVECLTAFSNDKDNFIRSSS